MTTKTQPRKDCLPRRWGPCLKKWINFIAKTVAWLDLAEALLGLSLPRWILRLVMSILFLMYIWSSLLDSRYLAHGTATDYIYDVVRTPMAFTFEVCMPEYIYLCYQTLSWKPVFITVTITIRYMETTRLLQEIALKCSTLLIYPLSRYYRFQL